MIEIISWNIQNGRGVDDVISLDRIASVIQSMGDADVICLQEISRNLILGDEATAADQVEVLQTLFPDYYLVFGVAIEAANKNSASRWQYGNAILSRLPILSVFKHSLPQPADKGLLHMARQATEITVLTESGPLRITTSHLEYHSLKQRNAQIARLRELHQEISRNEELPRKMMTPGPYQAIERPCASVLCGDFNMLPNSAVYQAMLKSSDRRSLDLYDAWNIVNSGQAHDPTCGLFDQAFWKEGPHCRDFFFVSENLIKSCQKVLVNKITDASDHQPLALYLGAS